MNVIACPHCQGAIDISTAPPQFDCPTCSGQIQIPAPKPAAKTSARVVRDWPREIISVVLLLAGLGTCVFAILLYVPAAIAGLALIVIALCLSYSSQVCSECRHRTPRQAKLCGTCGVRFGK